jgi:hypothetical protein
MVLERAHAECLGQRESLTVVMFGRLNLRGVLVAVNIAEEAQDPCLVAALVVLASKLEGTLGERYSVSRPGSEQIPLAQRGETV